MAQQEEFPNELAVLKNGNYLAIKFNRSLIRGRLNQFNLSFDTKHLIVPPKRQDFTTPLLRHLHMLDNKH
jgi:hypothetical protein